MMHATVQAFLGLLTGAGAAADLIASPGPRPARGATGVWVWRVSENPVVRPGLAPPQANPVPPPPLLHCLVFAPDLGALDQIRTLVHRSPVLQLPSGLVTVSADPLAADTLLALFAAAGTPPRPCLSYVLRAAPA